MESIETMMAGFMTVLYTGARIGAFALGFGLVVITLVSAVRTLVLPRAAADTIARTLFLLMRRIFDLRLRRAQSYLQRDRIMALFAPLYLLTLPPLWLTLVLLGYMGMFWAVETQSWGDLFLLSGSSLLTLVFASVYTFPGMVLAFSEATVGLILVALLIAYLPTMYDNFSQRETAVTMLAVRAGTPPSAVEMILRLHRIGKLEDMGDFWSEWEVTFSRIEESHTSLAALVFFRSPNPQHSWVTASGAVMDTAALLLAAVDIPWDPRAALCIRAGFIALQQVANFFQIPYNPDPSYPDDPVSISREEFDAACTELAKQGVPLKSDRDQAWQDFAGWRVNYDMVLPALCGLIMAPYATWSSDRSPTLLSPAQVKTKSVKQVQ